MVSFKTVLKCKPLIQQEFIKPSLEFFREKKQISLALNLSDAGELLLAKRFVRIRTGKYYKWLFTEYQCCIIDNEGFADCLPLTF